MKTKCIWESMGLYKSMVWWGSEMFGLWKSYIMVKRSANGRNFFFFFSSTTFPYLYVTFVSAQAFQVFWLFSSHPYIILLYSLFIYWYICFFFAWSKSMFTCWWIYDGIIIVIVFWWWLKWQRKKKNWRYNRTGWDRKKKKTKCSRFRMYSQSVNALWCMFICLCKV